MFRILMAGLCVTLAMPVSANNLEQRYQQSCGNCHTNGVMSAPRKGDRAAWAPRLAKGQDVLLAHVKNGYRMMPARGLCQDCTDAEFRQLIQYLSQ